jgi:putative nucleotidyltransferase with HDIG domain
MTEIKQDRISSSEEKIQLELEKRSWALSALSEAAAALARADSADLLIKEVCNAIAAQSPYIVVWVGKAEDNEEKTIAVIGSAGSAIDYLDDIVVSWADTKPSGMGPAGTCIRNALSVVIPETETDANFAPWRERAHQYGVHSAIGCPIPDGESHPYGCLMVYSAQPNTFGPDEITLFESRAHEIGFGLRAIERQHQLDIQIHEKELVQERLAGALRSTIEAMAKTMEWRDPYTAGHQKRVAQISMEIAKKLGMSSDEVQALYMAAMVHDIGKVAVPSEILTKPTHLTELEMKMVQEHAETGFQILKDIPFPWPIAKMVHQHHERLDGTGYPLGLVGDQICQEARILAVADTIEAMATHRPYRPARGLDTALEQIRIEAGTKLDAKVVDAVFALTKEGNSLQDIIESI